MERTRRTRSSTAEDEDGAGHGSASNERDLGVATELRLLELREALHRHPSFLALVERHPELAPDDWDWAGLGGEGEVLTSSGGPLPGAAAIEAATGANLQGVRAHHGPMAKQVCETVGAEAFTIGGDVVFAQEKPDLELQAHEAAHAVQQGAARMASGHGGAVTDEGSSHEPGSEAEADAFAAAVMEGRSATIALGSRGEGVQRRPKGSRSGAAKVGEEAQDRSPKLLSLMVGHPAAGGRQLVAKAFFPNDGAELDPADLAVVAEAVESGRGSRVVRFEVHGYASIRGTAEHNMRLSLRRADAVSAAIVHSLVSSPYDEAEPEPEIQLRAHGARGDEASEAEHRRVDIYMLTRERRASADRNRPISGISPAPVSSCKLAS